MNTKDTLKRIYELHLQKEEFLKQIPMSISEFLYTNEFSETAAMQIDLLLDNLIPEEEKGTFYDILYDAGNKFPFEIKNGSSCVSCSGIYYITSFEDYLNYLESKYGI